MNQYTFTAYTDSTSATTRSYTINIGLGSTYVDAGINPQYGLYEKWTFQELFISDISQQIITKSIQNFYTDSGWTTSVHIEDLPKSFTTFSQNSPAVYGLDASGNTITIVPQSDKFTFWDEALGVPLLRKFFANAMLENFNIPDYFDEDALLGE